jgi:hypothetical protein
MNSFDEMLCPKCNGEIKEWAVHFKCRNCKSKFKKRFPVSVKKIDVIIDYILGVEIPLNINEFFDENGNNITKKKYGSILIRKLCKLLKKQFKD